jgi:hypothetical protein
MVATLELAVPLTAAVNATFIWVVIPAGAV